MTSLISHTSVDCRDAFMLSEWWKRVLGNVDVEDDPNEPGHEECMILHPRTGHRVLSIETPDVKAAKNRLHFDLRPTDATRDEEVERLVALGATVLADPEGNEFCVLRSESERAG